MVLASLTSSLLISSSLLIGLPKRTERKPDPTARTQASHLRGAQVDSKASLPESSPVGATTAVPNCVVLGLAGLAWQAHWGF